MDLKEYQQKSQETNQFANKDRSLSSSMWNLTETVGIISRLYDEKARRPNFEDKEYKEQMAKKLGDVLWYIANTSACLDLNLNDIATQNLEKCQSRWGKKKKVAKAFDDNFPPDQQLPKKMIFKIDQDETGRVRMSVELKEGGEIALGARVTDNAYSNDGYRFHDVIHIAFMTVLGWSPVMRALLNRKRKNAPKVDEVEDGARAINLEEAISAMIYEHARTVDFFETEKYVSFELLKWIEKITRELEASQITYDLWNDAIIQGYAAWRETNKNEGGFIECDSLKKTIKYKPLK